MTTDRSLELRVSRLENDTVSIYDLLTKLTVGQDEHTRRLDGIDTRLDGIDTRLDGIDTRLDGIDTRLTRHDERFDRIDATLAEVLRRLPAS